MPDPARDRAIEVAPEKMLRHHAEAFVDALLARPEVLRALADQTTPDTSDVPKIWWSPSLAAASHYSNASAGLIWRYVSGQGYVTPPELPSDAVRLVPAAATTPTDDAIEQRAHLLYERVGTGADDGLDPLTSIQRHPLWEKLNEATREVWRGHVQAVQVLAGEVERARADLLAEKREHLRTIDDALKVRDEWTTHKNAVLALAGELDQAQYPAGVSWLHAFAARLRETLGEKTAGPG